jgi:hypothetical protein
MQRLVIILAIAVTAASVGVVIWILAMPPPVPRIPEVPIVIPKAARFWERSAVTVVKVKNWHSRTASAGLGQNEIPKLAQVNVEAVLAAEKMLPSTLELRIYPNSNARRFSGPIRPGGTFLVYMVNTAGQWTVPGNVRVSFMPKGLESVAAVGVSDPLVAQLQKKIWYLIAHINTGSGE